MLLLLTSTGYSRGQRTTRCIHRTCCRCGLPLYHELDRHSLASRRTPSRWRPRQQFSTWRRFATSGNMVPHPRVAQRAEEGEGFHIPLLGTRVAGEDSVENAWRLDDSLSACWRRSDYGYRNLIEASQALGSNIDPATGQEERSASSLYPRRWLTFGPVPDPVPVGGRRLASIGGRE